LVAEKITEREKISCTEIDGAAPLDVAQKRRGRV
jgi:hypothetical protein